MIREQLQGMFGAAGFDHQRDIQAITVNRWSHGYSYFLNGLFDDEKEAEQIIHTARQPIGRITIANSVLIGARMPTRPSIRLGEQ